jgi:hypothetical protein
MGQEIDLQVGLSHKNMRAHRLTIGEGTSHTNQGHGAALGLGEELWQDPVTPMERERGGVAFSGGAGKREEAWSAALTPIRPRAGDHTHGTEIVRPSSVTS